MSGCVQMWHYINLSYYLFFFCCCSVRIKEYVYNRVRKTFHSSSERNGDLLTFLTQILTKCDKTTYKEVFADILSTKSGICRQPSSFSEPSSRTWFPMFFGLCCTRAATWSSLIHITRLWRNILIFLQISLFSKKCLYWKLPTKWEELGLWPLLI